MPEIAEESEVLPDPVLPNVMIELGDRDPSQNVHYY